MAWKSRTTAECLKDPDNAAFVTQMIIDQLRERGDWGRRGLFKKIADKTGFSSAYVGRVLTGKQRITEDFLEALTREFELSVTLQGEGPSGGNVGETIDTGVGPQDEIFLNSLDMINRYIIKNNPQKVSESRENYVKRMKSILASVLAQGPASFEEWLDKQQEEEGEEA